MSDLLMPTEFYWVVRDKDIATLVYAIFPWGSKADAEAYATVKSDVVVAPAVIQGTLNVSSR